MSSDNKLGTFNFHVCDYEDRPHLCYIHGGLDWSKIQENDIVDETYTKVQTVKSVGPIDGANIWFDNHEFHLVQPSKGHDVGNNSAIINTFTIIPYNATLHGCDGYPNITWIKCNIFQEVSLDGSNTVLFEWNSINHIGVEETNQCPEEEAFITGNGTSIHSPLDYFHMNSVEKDENDDYLISARHTSTIYKIDGRTGEVLWRLGGQNSSFQLESELADQPLKFAYQHHARYDNLMTGADGVSKFGITIWNNQNNLLDQHKKNADYSSGSSILIDESTMVATLKQSWVSPERQLDRSQGSHQVLPNRNHFLGLGSVPYMAEFDADQELVFYANLGDAYNNQKKFNVESYRSFRFPWVGKPKDQPALFAYAPNCHDSTNFYVSWNGATEVKYWGFFVGRSSADVNSNNNSNNNVADDDGNTPNELMMMTEVATASRAGFETTARGGSGTHAYAVAYDANRTAIGTSATVQIFVPDYSIFERCTQLHCGYGFDYAGAARKSCHAASKPALQFVTPEQKQKQGEEQQAGSGSGSGSGSNEEGNMDYEHYGTLEKELDSPIRIQLR